MAAHQGLDFGTDVVFTYGPLGFLGLGGATLWFGDLAVIAFLFQSLLFVALACSLVWTLARSIGAVPAAIAAFAALALADGIEVAIVLVVIWSFVVLGPERPRQALDGLAIGGGVLAAVETLVKLSIGPALVVICLLTLIGARSGPGRYARFGVTFAVTLVALWLADGQSLGQLTDYFANGREVVSGYSDALGVAASPAWQGYAAAAVVAVLALAAATARWDGARARAAAVAVMAVAGFLVFKEAVVRFDPVHISVFFPTALLLWLALPWRGSRRIGQAAGAIALFVVAVSVLSPGSPRLNPIDNARVASDGLRTLVDSERRGSRAEAARQRMKDVYQLDPGTLAAIDGSSVAIEPWEIGVAWAYGLNWSPLPVIQGYAAYTPELDRLNAERAGSSAGPERILRQNSTVVPTVRPTRTIDNRFPGWDPPAQALAVLCHFEPLSTTDRWQVLGRVGDRCGEPEPIGTVDAFYGVDVTVPKPPPGAVVFARIEGGEPHGRERIRSLLLRSRPRFALLDGGVGYRLLPATATDGLLLRGAQAITGSGPYAQAPQAKTIRISGGPGGLLRYEFFALPVDAARPGGAN